jgi:Protein of unknown function (DUF3300)
MRTPLLPVPVATLALAVLAALSAPALRADAPPPPPALNSIDQLTAPIALYPDPLVALILPASTEPDDVETAAEYVSENGDPTQIENQPWDPSVRGLAHYPTVLQWMAQNPEWTRALGEAFANNSPAVMESIQRLRAMASSAGTLADTPQQDVVDEDGQISIVPAEPDTIYVPSYDPNVVYAGPAYYGYGVPYMSFGIGFSVGFWLGYELDWHRHAIWIGDWRNWRNEHGWSRPVFPGQHGYIDSGQTRHWIPVHSVRAGYLPPQHPPQLRIREPAGSPRESYTRQAAPQHWSAGQPAPRPATAAPWAGWPQRESVQHPAVQVRQGQAPQGAAARQAAPSGWGGHPSSPPSQVHYQGAAPSHGQIQATHAAPAPAARQTQVQRNDDPRKDHQH